MKPFDHNHRIGTPTFSTDRKATILILYLVAFCFLWLGYAKFIVPLFGYSGFDWKPNSVKILESSLALLFFVWILPVRIKRPSDFFIHVHFLLPVLPMLVLYGASDLPRIYMCYVILAFTVVSWVRKFNLPKIKGDIIPIQFMMWGLLTFAATYILSIIMQGGLRYFNLNLLRVYEFRADAAENLPGIAGYLTPMVANIVLPSLLLLAIYCRKWFITGLTITGSVIMFSLTGHKGTLFYPFIVLGLYYIMRSNAHLIRLLLICYSLVILISIAPFFINQKISNEESLSGVIAGSLILRRGYFIPPRLNFVYYEFFSIRPHTMLAESKLTFGLVDYRYPVSSPRVIGDYFFGNKETSANTGWLGSGYMHFGFPGMLLYGLLVGLLLSVVDMLAKNRDLWISGAIVFTPFLALFVSSDPPTVMLTGGLMMALFLAWACRLKVKKNG